MIHTDKKPLPSGRGSSLNKYLPCIISFVGILLICIDFCLPYFVMSDFEREIKFVVDETNKFYFYNVTIDGTYRNKTELMQKGGDCETWSLYYKAILGEKYKTSVHTFAYKDFGVNATYHAFVTVSNGVQYCVIDQTNYNCFFLS